jgi:predicted Zn-dependent protease with MMP-like domain
MNLVPQPTLEGWRAIATSEVSQELDRLAGLCADNPTLLAELNRVSVVIVDEAPRDEPDLLGLYLGRPVTDSFEPGFDLPPLVQLFLLPLVDYVTPDEFPYLEPDLTKFRAEVVITIRHELAHHFGLDHELLDQLGLG